MLEDFEKFIKDPFIQERISFFRKETRDVFLKIMEAQGLSLEEKAFITCDITANCLAVIRTALDERLVEKIVKLSKLISETLAEKAKNA